MGEALNAYTGLNDFGSMIAAGDRDDDDAAPKGFVTIMLFDKHHNLLDANWDQLDEAYEQTSTPPAKDAFDHLIKQMVVREEGYAYVFVSNENPTKVDIHFDDFTVTHKKTNVIQYNEYYPFGLQTSTSWTRENTKDNNYLYNAANELNKTNGWYEMYYRGYDPAIGRMLQVDPYATMYASFTTYNYAVNNPVYFNDPSGGQVDVTGLTNSQLRSVYLSNRWRDLDTGSFSDWASDNATGTSLDGMYFGGGGSPTVYNRWCGCNVNAFDVLAYDGQGQNKKFREAAQAAVDKYNSSDNILDWILDLLPGKRYNGSKVTVSAGSNIALRVKRLGGVTFNPKSQVLYLQEWTNRGNKKYIGDDNDGKMMTHTEIGGDAWVFGANYERLTDHDDEYGQFDGMYNSDNKEITVNVSVLTFKLSWDSQKSGATFFYGLSIGGGAGLGVGVSSEAFHGNTIDF